jgi:hypothetical protein
VKDSLEWPIQRWLRLRWRPLTGVGFAVCAIAVLLVMRSQGTLPDKTGTIAEQRHSFAPAPIEVRFTKARTNELTEADRQYLKTILDLRDMLEEDRALWSPKEAAAVDARLAEYRKEAIGTRMAIANEGAGVRSRDMLYAGYRSEIGFLQSTLAGDLPGGR